MATPARVRRRRGSHYWRYSLLIIIIVGVFLRFREEDLTSSIALQDIFQKSETVKPQEPMIEQKIREKTSPPTDAPTKVIPVTEQPAPVIQETEAPKEPETMRPTEEKDIEDWLKRKRENKQVRCGGHTANSCAECSQGHGPSWCHGDCWWKNNQCESRPMDMHWAYADLISEYPFHSAVTEDGRPVNIIMVRAPLNNLQKKLFQRFRKEILFIGISSFESYPKNSPNPFSGNFSDEPYRNMFDGFLSMFHEDDPFFLPPTKTILMSQSDFNIEPALRFGRGYDNWTKEYDFVYSGSDQEVHNNCVGWSSFAKNWSFVLEALEVMCDDEFNLTGVLAATKDKKGEKACTIPEKCQGKITQTSFLSQNQFFTYAKKSKFVFLPQIYDASPRVAAQALSLNVPILMNQNIVGGWKYLNEKTGEFFHDMSNFKQQLRKILSNYDKYEPRQHMESNYGNEKSGRIFRKWVEENFPQVEFPNGTQLLLPLWK